MRTLLPLFAGVLAACGGRDPHSDQPTERPTPTLVVYWTVDTLGATVAEEIGWCDRIGAVLGAHGLEGACLDGAVAPASWTAESHSRLLWPEHTDGLLRATGVPDCQSKSSLRLAADTIGAPFLFGADNPVFYVDREADDCDGGGPFTREADVVYETFGEIGACATRPEPDRAARKALEDALVRIAAGEPVVLFLNDLEAGGHVPRCWYDPTLPACEDLWAFAVSEGVVASTDDPATAYLSDDFWKDVGAAVGRLPEGDAAGMREAVWSTIVDAADHFGASRTGARLEDLLAGVEAAGRADELLLVMLADHGENPCIRIPFTNNMNCEHGDLPTDYTARVPVIVSPASAAESWAAAGLVASDAPWSAANLSWGLADAVGAPIPEAWPEPEPVGGASSWYCRTTQSAGIRVEGDVSLRCVGAMCGAWRWDAPTGPDWSPEQLSEIPAELAPWGPGEDGRNAFEEACSP